MALFYLKKLEKNETHEYGLHYQDQVILKCDKEDTKAIEELAHSLNKIYAEHEISIRATNKMLEWTLQLITDTLADKLSEIDNMYAMKKMLTESANELEKLTNRIIQMNKEGLFDKKETTKGEE